MLAQANAVHHALERFYGVRPEQRSLEVLHRALRHVWPQHRKPGTFAHANEEASYGLAALEMLTLFSERFDTTIVPLAREQWLSVRMPNGFQLYGKLDRIDNGRGGGIEVVDYKTGRSIIDEDDLPRDLAAQVYLLAAEAELSRRVERVRFVYVAQGEEVSWEPEREDVDAIGERITDLLERIRHDDEFPAYPGPQCRFCPFALICPDRQRVELDDLAVAEEVLF